MQSTHRLNLFKKKIKIVLNTGWPISNVTMSSFQFFPYRSIIKSHIGPYILRGNTQRQST